MHPGPAQALPTRPERIGVVGVLNVTPDSFSDGGCYADADAAITHGLAMHQAGADLVDVGGESTRPGADRIDADEECRRVLPVVRGLADAGVAVSVDTTRSAVAAAALAEGATVVNDVSGGLADPVMAAVVRDAGCPWIVMHSRGPSATMPQRAHYDDVVADVRRELLARIDAAIAAGVAPQQLAIDPGLGFAKNAAHNWALLGALDSLVSIGLPVLVGASRKSFLGRLLAAREGTARPVAGREDATTAITALCARAGVWGVRVHEVQPSVDAALVVGAVRAAAAAADPALADVAQADVAQADVAPADAAPADAAQAEPVAGLRMTSR